MNSQAAMFGELFRYRGLLGMLAWRDIRVRYKQSLLGVAWAFLMPLIQTAVLVLVFTSSTALTIDDTKLGGMPYMLFVLAGIIPWTLFNATIASSMECLTRNSRLVTKIYFPREVFPLANVLGALVDFGIALSVFIPVYIFYMFKPAVAPFVQPHPSVWLLLIPVILFFQVLLIAGLSMVLSMANLFFRDVKYVMTFVLQLWFFATNVMYPLHFEKHPWMTWINPMIAILDAYRDCWMGRGLTNPSGLLVSILVSTIAFFLGWRVFHRASFKFAEYV
ncbi:MAG: tagG 1 [Phycisphaerales bacterium]|nr:tagG 1 [Phycisphaerales bacterium]